MIESIINCKGAELTQSAKGSGPVFLSTRVRLARNLVSEVFPDRATKAQRQQIFSRCSASLASLKTLQGAAVFEVEALSELERKVLIERHLVSRELCEADRSSAVIISMDQSSSVMINEEDHLRIQLLRTGFHLKKVWSAIDALDTALEEHIDYAYSPELGYLTACPTNLGTGMRASVMMHLPGLVYAEHMEKVVRSVNQLGLTVRGLFGEGSDATGHIFQISNQQTLGEEEVAILSRLDKVLRTIKDHEINARYRLLESESERGKLLDQIGRAYGILENAHILSSNEAMNLLSLLRLAVDFSLLPEEFRATVDRLFIECQPGHIQFYAGHDFEPDHRDFVRAEKLRSEMRNLPPLNFDNLVQSK